MVGPGKKPSWRGSNNSLRRPSSNPSQPGRVQPPVIRIRPSGSRVARWTARGWLRFIVASGTGEGSEGSGRRVSSSELQPTATPMTSPTAAIDVAPRVPTRQGSHDIEPVGTGMTSSLDIGYDATHTRPCDKQTDRKGV